MQNYATNNKKEKVKRVRLTFMLPENVEIILRNLSESSGLKMSKIVENGILIFKERLG